MGERELLNNFPGLTPFDLLAAQVYYQAHPDEIDTLITSHHSEEGWQWRSNSMPTKTYPLI
jgi:hypothetical protein